MGSNAGHNAELRPDLALIAAQVPVGARVLDIGCGDGQLLRFLVQEKQADARGMELLQERVSQSVAEGLSVIQGNADTDLQHYPDKAFDVVILSIALQMMQHPQEVLRHMARIASQVIVSIPNFGHVSNRLYLALRGRMPVTSALSYEWYDTPNIHFCTLHDFEVMAKEMGLQITSRHWLNRDNQPLSLPGCLANLFAQKGVFVLGEK